MTVLGETAKAVGRFFDGRAEKYEERAASPYWRLLREITWQHVRRFLPRDRNARILDVGGATGYWSIRLAKEGYSVVLFDSSEGMLRIADRNILDAGLAGKIETVLGDVTDLREFSEASFDAVLAVEGAISFCSDPEMAVAEMALVTKPDGMVAVSANNRFKSRELEKYVKKGDIEGLERFLGSGRAERGTGTEEISTRAFSASEIEGLLTTNGLEVVSSIGRPIFAEAAGGRLEDPAVFTRILGLEMANNVKRSLWGGAEVLEFVAMKA